MSYKTLSKKVQPIDPTCTKTLYYNKEDAQDMIEYLENEKGQKGQKGIKSYQCAKCGYWHLTSN